MRARFLSSLACLLVLIPGLLLADAEQDLQAEARRQTESIRQGGAGWPVTETEFFRLRVQPGAIAGPAATILLDAFTGDALAKLGFTPGETARWRRTKWDYYLGDDATVQTLTGYPTKGMADLAGRAIISSHFPHFHELVHLLADQQKKPGATQTHPLIQEGLACLLGGRWGRSPEVVLYTGWVMQNLGMAELEPILTRQGFHEFPAGPDATYALGAAVCEVVRRAAGWPGVMALSGQVSGSVTEVAAISAEDLVKLVGGICGWDEQADLDRLQGEVDRVLADYRRCGIEPVQEFPEAGLTDCGGPGSHFTRVEAGKERFLEVCAEAYPVYLLSPENPRSAGGSALFGDHFPGGTHQGQRYGLKCSPEEIGLYDYHADQVVAIWVGGFTGESFSDDVLLFRCSSRLSEAVDQLQTSVPP